MKIAMIGHKRIPSREGGIEVAVEEISTRLVQRGYSIDVYNRKSRKNNNINDKSRKKENKNKNKEDKYYKGIRIITIPTLNIKGIEAAVYSFLATIVAVFRKYACIHYHAEGPCAMLWIPHLFKIKTVATIHGLDWKRAKWGGFASKYIKFGEKVAAKYADEIIVLSRDIQKYFKEEYNRNTIYIPNGVNKPEKRKPEIIYKKYGLSKNSYILFLARIVPEKGLHYLIDAYKQLKTDKKLVIAGGGSHTDDYVNSIKNMIKDNNNIIMTGFVKGKELDELYTNCYIYCLPSDVEGMPISLLEAMSYGSNCLVSNIEENTQVIGKYAQTFKKSDKKDLKEKLNNMLQGKGLKDSKEIEKYILEKYRWENVIEELEKIYNKGKRW